jgi:hypothetical protein
MSTPANPTGPTNPVPTVPQAISRLDSILITLEVLAEIATAVPGVGQVAGLAEKLLAIAQAAIGAHEAATGQPLDLSLLHNIDPLP